MLTRGQLGRAYNPVGLNERSNLAVVETIADLLDRAVPSAAGPRRRLITFVGDRPGHDLRYAIDATRIETELGRAARHSFETGLAETIAWYLASGDWWQPLRAERDLGERLGKAAT